MDFKRFFLIVLCLVLSGLFVHSQASWERNTTETGSPAGLRSANVDSELALRRIALFSSGVGFFEHYGNIAPFTAGINLPFDAAAVNDVLKSLVINDPASTSVSVRYASEDTLWRTLRSLRIDLSGSVGIAEILNSLRGAELEVTAPSPIRGRIIGVEYRQSAMGGQPWLPPAMEAWLSLFTPQGIRVIAITDIASFRFIDESINSDLNRALDLIMTSRDESTRNLLVTMDGAESRNVSLSYVIPAPVWKVSYRLDLSGAEPFLQGWAIVDNDSDTDWKDVELSLVIGRPVSFIQNLYPPYRVFRPVLPLAIAGIADGRAHESGYNLAITDQARSTMMMRAMPEMEVQRDQARGDNLWGPAPQAAPAVAGGTMLTAASAAAGDQFLFTLRNPVSLERRQSAMLPLVEGTVKAERTLVFSGARALSGLTINPEISAELTNTSGMRLPAGPITVYDGGIYAGDALIEFFPENERRLISFGEDLSVTGNLTSSTSRNITAVNISGGVMIISRRLSHERTYTIRNASEEAKRIIIEHPVTSGAELAEPRNADDRTATLYRFNRNLPARETLTFNVREETPLSERITLAQLRPETFLSYATNQEIPANVRAVLNRAIELRRIADEATTAQAQLESQLSRLISEQDRIRRNLEAAGNQSPQGQEYLRRLAALDNDIDSLNSRIDTAIQETQRTRREYENYLATISL
jgi:hypothetical protein